MLRYVYLALTLGLLGLSASPYDAAAQTSSARQRLAQTIPFDCLDRCFADFKTCLGTPPRQDPPVIIPPPNSGGNVPTPPSFDQCKRARDECEAQCLPPPK